MTHTITAGAIVLGATLLAATAACTSPAPERGTAASPAPAPELGPRPALLPLDGIDPCALITPEQRRQLRLTVGRNSDVPGTHEPACNWDIHPRTPDDSWGVTLKTNQPAGAALSGAGAQLVYIGGFPAVQTSSAFGGRDYGCILLIDVAPGQSLIVGYENVARDRPGISHEVACQQAVRGAELMVATLRTLTR